MEECEHTLKISSLKLIRFGCEGVLKILAQKDHLLNLFISDEAVCRTAPATPAGSVSKSEP